MYKRRYNGAAVVPYGRGGFRGRGRRTSYHNKRRYPMYRKFGVTRGFKAKVQQAVGAELKFIPHFSLLEASNDNPNATFISIVDQGTGSEQRVGNWCSPSSVHGTVRCHGNPEASPETWTIRVGVLRYNDNSQGTSLFGSGFMEDPQRPGGPFKVASKGEFSVLWTRVLIVSNNTDNTLFTRALRYRVNLKNSPKCLYEGAGAGSRTKNHLIFFAVSDCAVTALSPPSVDFDSMFRYTDS